MLTILALVALGAVVPPPSAVRMERQCATAAKGLLGQPAVVVKRGTANPKALRMPRPELPRRALATEWQGTFFGELLIDKTGKTRGVWIAREPEDESSDDDGLDKAVLSAYRRWRFEPLVVGGTPVPACVAVSTTFTLDPEGRKP